MYKIGFMGTGKMAQALIGATLLSELAEPKEIICSDIQEATRKEVAKSHNVIVTDDNRQVISQADMVVLAIKPQNFLTAAKDLTGLVRPEQIIISIMAGIRIERIRPVLPGRVVRVMPNTACLVGQMAAGYACDDTLMPDDKKKVEQFLACAGKAVEVTQDQLDAVTGLSGSGPAFVAYLIDGFIRAGLAQGLTADVARDLALQTFTGTAMLLQQWQMSPADLIAMVSSPNGTTVAGRKILEESDVQKVIAATVKRATERSEELGK